MNLELFRDYCISKKGVTEGFPFSKLPDVLVFKVADKMFAVTYISPFDKIALKCDPELIFELKEKYNAVEKPAYFNEQHWIAVAIDSSVPNAKIFEWIDNSYDLVVSKLTKKQKNQLDIL